MPLFYNNYQIHYQLLNMEIYVVTLNKVNKILMNDQNVIVYNQISFFH